MADEEYYELGMAAYAGNGCIFCFSTTHLAGPEGCPRDLEPEQCDECPGVRWPEPWHLKACSLYTIEGKGSEPN